MVTDTTACIPSELVKTLDIEVVPVPLIINQKTYRDGIDITPAEFYAMLRKLKKLPTTSASSPTPYLEAFRNTSHRVHHIICLTEPSKFTSMYNSARAAVDMSKNIIRDATIEVIECTTAAAGEGLVALAAAKAAALDKPLEEVKKITYNVMSKVNLYASLDTLQYLARSGRVPQAAALVNSILNIKPVFTLNHADPHTVGLPRTTKSALDRILKLMNATVKKGQQLHVAVMHGDAIEEATILRDRIISRFECKEIYITEFTPVIGVHTGPDIVGVAFYGE